LPLPSDPGDVSIVPSAVAYLEGLASELLTSEWKGVVEKRQSCYLPVNTESGGLVLGFLKGVEGVVAATGHSVRSVFSSLYLPDGL
jgi:glycine/D-amino acid oxidase-like deaminating enzyme